ncbi:hypothetical protein BASA50_002086 [Batrachochytrium salamandrivorans]|uniref:Translation initiation factor IF-2, mitochondrial n=1 Tax=Batrachochytrium salamandrivorans TaxID=1357716 RepID=A0ABQ8FMC9_9FUNG|nr:hypothetical protein BASA50_002086 [Batrachochytrium salamandrivorans]
MLCSLQCCTRPLSSQAIRIRAHVRSMQSVYGMIRGGCARRYLSISASCRSNYGSSDSNGNGSNGNASPTRHPTDQPANRSSLWAALSDTARIDTAKLPIPKNLGKSTLGAFPTSASLNRDAATSTLGNGRPSPMRPPSIRPPPMRPPSIRPPISTMPRESGPSTTPTTSTTPSQWQPLAQPHESKAAVSPLSQLGSSGLYPGKSIDISKWTKMPPSAPPNPVRSATGSTQPNGLPTYPKQGDSFLTRPNRDDTRIGGNPKFSRNHTSPTIQPANHSRSESRPPYNNPYKSQSKSEDWTARGPPPHRESFPPHADGGRFPNRSSENPAGRRLNLPRSNEGTSRTPLESDRFPKKRRDFDHNPMTRPDTRSDSTSDYTADFLSNTSVTGFSQLDGHDGGGDYADVVSRAGDRGTKHGRDKERRQRELDRKERELALRLEKEKKTKSKAIVKNVMLPEGITIANLGTLLEVKYEKLARKMIQLGFTDTDYNYVLTAENASLIVMEYGMNPIVVEAPKIELEARPEPTDWSTYSLRPPVVTIMGHVDHGKTTLLDSLRKTSVAAGEAGGITQHIGAFSVVLPSSQRITFLDTPGHAAFSAMRKRGAQTTDIVVLVVAADDGVMPQTVEAIKHSLDANVPIIVAINKCDKPGINLRKIKEGLIRYDLILEEFGGEVPAVEISGLTGKGLDDLEETILTVAEVLDVRGDASGPCEGVVIESKLNREQGNVATILVRRGTLRPGALIVAGGSWCKVRKLIDENGDELEEAGPSTPISVTGWKSLPSAGDEVLEAENEALAKRVVQSRFRQEEQLQSLKLIGSMNEKRSQERAIRLEEKESKDRKKTKIVLKKTVDPDAIPELRLVIKADVHGTLEALESVINALPCHEVQATIVSTGVGAVSDTDVSMAIAAGAEIVAFNAPCDRRVLREATIKKIKVHQHQIIYKLIDDIKYQMGELLPPEIVKEVTGEADVLQIFSVNTKGQKSDTAAGCKITNGKVLRGSTIRIMRDGKEIFQGSIKTFKHHKKDITEASKGLECGIELDGFSDYMERDVFQAVKTTEVKRTIS